MIEHGFIPRYGDQGGSPAHGFAKESRLSLGHTEARQRLGQTARCGLGAYVQVCIGVVRLSDGGSSGCVILRRSVFGILREEADIVACKSGCRELAHDALRYARVLKQSYYCFRHGRLF